MCQPAVRRTQLESVSCEGARLSCTAVRAACSQAALRSQWSVHAPQYSCLLWFVLGRMVPAATYGGLDEEFLKRRRKLCDTIVVPPGCWLDGVLQGDGVQLVAPKRQRVAACSEECLEGACRGCVKGARAMGRCLLCAGLPDDDLRKWFYAEKACSGPDPFDQPRKTAESVVEVGAFVH